MKRFLHLFLALGAALGFALPAAADTPDSVSVMIYGECFRKFDKQVIRGLKAELLTADSVVVDTFTVGVKSKKVGSDAAWLFSIKTDGRLPAYIVRLSKRGYDTHHIDVPAGDYRNKRFVDLGRTLMRFTPPSQVLGEATVTATKVVFFHRGDTLVYNADALNLPDGASLDAIINQLPGVQLKGNGEIFVNGRKVEKLMLNGKDFFNDDNELMLENLPAYMVKHIDVYEKKSEMSEFLNLDIDDKSLVMDVKLKRKYQTGYMANVEAGGGSSNRYLARLFGMRFTPRTQLVAIGNFNNLNDDRKPGQETEWTPDKMPRGRTTTQRGGIDFNFDDHYAKLKTSTYLDVTHTSSHNLNRQSNERFLTSGNTFERSHSVWRNYNTSYKFGQQVRKQFDKVYLGLWLDADYQRTATNSQSVSALFSENPDDYLSPAESASLLDTLYGPASGHLLRKLAINRTRSDERSSRSGGNLRFYGTLFINGGWMVDANLNFSSHTAKNFQHYALDYPSAAALAAAGAPAGGDDAKTDYQNRYARTSPDVNAYASLRVVKWFGTAFGLKGLTVTPSYCISRKYGNKDYAYHRLDRLEAWAGENAPAIGTLPAAAEWDRWLTLDRENSYKVREEPLTNEFMLSTSYNRTEGDERTFRVQMDLPVNVATQRLRHRRASYDGKERRTDAMFEPYFYMRYYWLKKGGELGFSYRTSVTPPDLLDNLLELPNTADPLNIYTGNAALKPSRRHTFNADFEFKNKEKMRNFRIAATYEILNDAIFNGVTYNPETGVRRYRPENVDGTRYAYAWLNFGLPLGRKPGRWRLEGATYMQLHHSVDLLTATSTDDFAVMEKSKADTWWTTQDLNIAYTFGKTTVRANGYGGYNRAVSTRPGFLPQTVWVYRYGLSLQTELVWGLRFSTDLKMYSQRGFAEASANTDDLVWNARLSRSFKRPALTLIIDGFDILRQLSNRHFSMNANGRFESFSNALPSYVLAHVVWRFNKSPKKND